jgi:hypothetical protein
MNIEDIAYAILNYSIIKLTLDKKKKNLLISTDNFFFLISIELMSILILISTT